MNLKPNNITPYTLESYKLELTKLEKELVSTLSENDFCKETIEQIPNDMETKIKRQIAIIKSMTYEEKMNPSIFDKSRLQRVANGSGQKIKDLHLLLKQYKRMKKFIMKLKSKSNGNKPPPAIVA